MNRIQFLVLTILSGLVVVLLLAQVFEKRYSIWEQNLFTLQQQQISQGQACAQNWRLLGTAIVQQSQKNPNNTALKDIIVRQALLPPASSSSSSSAPAPDSSTPASSTNH